MKISDSAVSLHSEAESVHQYRKKETLHFWDDRPDDGQKRTGDVPVRRLFDRKDIYVPEDVRTRFQNLAGYDTIQYTGGPQASVIKISGKEFLADIKLQIIKDIIEHLTGRKIEVLSPEDVAAKDQAATGETTSDESVPDAQGTQASEGWGLEYTSTEETYSKESMCFSAQGALKTGDGRELRFSASLTMSKELYRRTDISIKAGDALIDPLVINFDGRGVQMNPSAHCTFDIDSDKDEEDIGWLAQGSGFLFLDGNRNGTVDNGSELFGPSSGNGFDELALHDSDKNGWIDENDPVFYGLRIWEKDGEGNDVYSGLKEKDVGALYLGRASTPFPCTDDRNTVHALVKETGFYLKETGAVGYLQEIDIAV